MKEQERQNMSIRHINHILFSGEFPVHVDGFAPIGCVIHVSFMRYDEQENLFFPIFVYADDDEDLYISAKYRLYPGGDITLVRKSDDIDGQIESQISRELDSFDLPSRVIEFVGKTKYSEIIEAQSC